MCLGTMCDIMYVKFPDIIAILLPWYPEGRLNKKDGLTRYGDSHVKDKTS